MRRKNKAAFSFIGRASTLNWPKQGKYNRVERALPYPSLGALGCKWRAVRTPSGRKMLEPVA